MRKIQVEMLHKSSLLSPLEACDLLHAEICVLL